MAPPAPYSRRHEAAHARGVGDEAGPPPALSTEACCCGGGWGQRRPPIHSPHPTLPGSPASLGVTLEAGMGEEQERGPLIWGPPHTTGDWRWDYRRVQDRGYCPPGRRDWSGTACYRGGLSETAMPGLRLGWENRLSEVLGFQGSGVAISEGGLEMQRRAGGGVKGGTPCGGLQKVLVTGDGGSGASPLTCPGPHPGPTWQPSVWRMGFALTKPRNFRWQKR